MSSAATSVIWICSKIKGLKGSLERVLPALRFVDVTENELNNFNEQLKVGHDDESKPEILIADNPFIGPLLSNRQLPFRFIQVTRVYDTVFCISAM